MRSTTIEAKLVLSGEDKGASKAVLETVKAIKAMGEATKVSAQVDKLARSLHDQEKAQKAVTAAMSARAGYEQAQAGLKATGAEAAKLAAQLDKARAARAAFDGVKAPRGSDQAREIKEATKAVREAGAAYRKAEGEVRRANAAVAAQTATLQNAERAAERLGADISNLVSHERALKRAIDGTTQALQRQIVAEDRAAAAAARSQARRAMRREAAGTVAAGAGIIASSRGKQIGLEAINSAASMDYATRYQVVATDVTEDDQRKILIPQAKRIGQETKFTNEDVIHAQTGTMQGLPFKDPNMKARVGSSIVEEARHYAVIMQSDMTRSSEGIRSFLQNTNKDISTPEKALAEAKRGTNLMVKMGKLGGMSDEDVQQFIKFGFPTGTQAGLSDVTLAALGAGGRRAGLRGDELGVFARAAASKLVAPTNKGLDALAVAGIDYSKFTKMPGGLNTGNLEAFSKRRFGKGFSGSQRSRLDDILEDGEVVGNREEFTKQVSAIVAEGYKGKKGKTSAQDSQKIAKMVGDFHKLSVESVDTEGLLRAIFSNPKMTAALRNAFFTDKHGGKAGMISSKMADFNSDVDELNKVGKDPDFAAKKSKYMTQGLGGSIDNLKGGWETLILNIGQANEGAIRFAADGLARMTDAFSNLSTQAQQIVSIVGLGGVYGTAKIAGKLLGFGALDTAGVKLTSAAVALEAAAVRLGAAPVAGAAAGAATGGAAAGSSLLGRLGPIAGRVGGVLAPLMLLRELGEAKRPMTPEGAPYRLDQAIEAGTWERAQRGAMEFKLDPEGKRGREMMRRNAVEAGKEAGRAAGQAITDGVREKAPEAGQAAGQGVADGVKEKAPEVEAQGRTILDRLRAVFSQGVHIPISFTPGEGGMGGGGGGGLIQRASFGGGSGGVAVGSGGVSVPGTPGTGGAAIRTGGRFGGLSVPGGGVVRTGLPSGALRGSGAPEGAGNRGVSGSVISRAGTMYDALRGAGFNHLHASALMGHQMEESTMNTGAWNPKEGAAGSIQWRADRRERLQAHARSMGLDWRDPRAQASFIRWEMANTERRSGARFLGSRTLEEASAALKGYIRYGSPTAADRLGHARTFDRQFRSRVPGAAGAAAGMPPPGPGYMVPLHKGGTGLSRYSDEQLREMEAADAERKRKAMERTMPAGPKEDVNATLQNVAATLRDMSLRTHHSVEVSASPGLTARTRGMGATARGPIKANVGVSMPGARDEGDWI
ncbi:phage tail tip lysozyme [Methylobacterium aquaticum]|uniref:phage tail tip lysozyme n=1 Tax=Methylobacterium aquaticum TaxID=270351 RepID=UPI003D185EC4